MTIAFPSEETIQRADSPPTLAPPPRKPISEKRLAANRLNALRSTGPRTPAGKQRVSANALKHGLRATTHLCPEESNHPAECSATYKVFETELQEELQPKTVLQKTLFPQIATLAWRLRRLPHTEQEIFAQLTGHRFPTPPPVSGSTEGALVPSLATPPDEQTHQSQQTQPEEPSLPSSIHHLPSSPPPPPPCQTLAQAFCSHDNANPFTLFNRYERSLQNAFLRLLRHYDHLKKHHNTRPTTPEETCPREPAWRDPIPPPPPPPPTDHPQPKVADHDRALPNKPTETPATISNPRSAITNPTHTDKQTHQSQSPTHPALPLLLLILCVLCASAVNPSPATGTMPLMNPLNRRQFLHSTGGGLGALAASYLLSHDLASAAAPPSPRADLNGGLHHRAKVKRIVQLFMNGGASPMDTFDYKPALAKLHGQPFDPGTGALVEAVTSMPGKVMKSPFEFKQHGNCGRWVSSVFPQIATRVDDLTFLMSMASKSNVHGLASYMQNTGFILPGFPAMGAWISYGLGRLNDTLPAFVVLPDPRGLPYNNQSNFSSAFLPAAHAGVIVRASDPTPISDLLPPKDAKEITPASEADGLALLRTLNARHLATHPGDSRLDARIESYELAARMQTSAPELLDLTGETDATRKLYGLDDKTTEDFARRCLIARRMLERGVRFVQVWSGPAGATKNWDNHADIPTELPFMAGKIDRPTAALLTDLKSRGLFADTLFIWTTEFGRMPFSQGQNGRDHNGGTFVTFLAGAGLKPGIAHGQSDEWAWRAQQPIYCYDLHATILHLMGIDHTKLTFRHNGIDRRLTDVHGEVIREILA